MSETMQSILRVQASYGIASATCNKVQHHHHHQQQQQPVLVNGHAAVFEKTCATTQKTQKVMSFGFKKTLKTLKNGTYSFTGLL